MTVRKKNSVFCADDSADTISKFTFEENKGVDCYCTACSAGSFKADDILSFRATKQISLQKAKPVNINLVVKNLAVKPVTRLANVVGIQNGIEVYNQIISASGTEGSGDVKFEFPQMLPIVTGDIAWLAIIYNNNFDGDTAMATTKVID
jgi:hypothetical protein